MLSRIFKTKEQKEEFNQLIKSCIIYRFTNEEIQDYIKSKMGVEVSLDLIAKTIKDLKNKDTKSKLALYENNRDEYLYEKFERSEELKINQKELWRIVDKNPTNPMLQVDCLAEIRENTKLLTDLNNRIFSQLLKKEYSPETSLNNKTL
jgi:hypothetical protein